MAKDSRFTAGFGSEFKKSVRHWYTTSFWMTTRAEMLSRFENYAEIDPNGVVDAWGIPVLKIHIEHSDNEREMAKDAAESCQEVLKAAGAEMTWSGSNLTAPGRIIHELCTARMGSTQRHPCSTNLIKAGM